MKCQMLNLDQRKRLLPPMKPCSFCAHKVLPQYEGFSHARPAFSYVQYMYRYVYVQYRREYSDCRLRLGTFRPSRGQRYKIVPEVIGARTAMRMSMVCIRDQVEYLQHVLYSVLILPGARCSGLLSSFSALPLLPLLCLCLSAFSATLFLPQRLECDRPSYHLSTEHAPYIHTLHITSTSTSNLWIGSILRIRLRSPSRWHGH